MSEYKPKDCETLKEKSTLKELGYKDIVLNSIDNEAEFFIEIPKDKSLTKDAYFEFYLRYSNLLDFNKSSLCIMVNDVPYTDKTLSLEKIQRDSIRINLREIAETGTIKLKLKFNLIPKNKKDVADVAENLFAVILSDSILYKPTKQEKEETFFIFLHLLSKMESSTT
ncbi:cellulose biosynthesis cyclic di-GMP-binding regulatory protein BcsB [Caloramator sp. mosi_1]|uniref:cellulose biosynthesis cyclic di-GMP-binding regulatory protein BcsB n=1 Tax=Caloramator sp. mosi_1 TaxID=3023090 RepID=UPI0023604849|nr:cellulose biosynthesis cyclic di-GMP-binding regulatory protein BcsB [Caloramator sp. mosi_1]WDC85184.1 cellulose biosynthesis cyclic di-GMP-binding regulatory protein BcsB [Caloramator sp. mosi_1]